MLCLPAFSTRPDPIDWLLSVAQIKANFVAGQTQSPRRSSWHRRPKFAGLLFGKVYRAWPSGLALLRELSHSYPVRCARACHGVVIARKSAKTSAPSQRSARAETAVDIRQSRDRSTGSIHSEQAEWKQRETACTNLLVPIPIILYYLLKNPRSDKRGRGLFKGVPSYFQVALLKTGLETGAFIREL